MTPQRLIAALAVASAGLAPVARAGDELPAEFKQIVPRGRIASVDEPRFVPAQKAKLAPEAWILGVVIEGQPRAYSLNLLNHHEVVNDRVGDTAFAAVW
jgi:hypothetical protein